VHWEGDALMGMRHRHAIVSHVERKRGYALLAKVKLKTSDLVSSAIIGRLKGVRSVVKSITYNNGKEFADNFRIDEALGSTGYFSDHFSNW
jgi:IS30 family transposase